MVTITQCVTPSQTTPALTYGLASTELIIGVHLLQQVVPEAGQGWAGEVLVGHQVLDGPQLLWGLWCQHLLVHPLGDVVVVALHTHTQNRLSRLSTFGG